MNNVIRIDEHPGRRSRPANDGPRGRLLLFTGVRYSRDPEPETAIRPARRKPSKRA